MASGVEYDGVSRLAMESHRKESLLLKSMKPLN